MTDQTQTPTIASEISALKSLTLHQLTAYLCAIVAVAGVVYAALPQTAQQNKWVGVAMMITGVVGKVLNAYGLSTTNASIAAARETANGKS